MVLAQDPETGETGYKEVADTFVKEKDTLVHVKVDETEIKTTKEHPFWVEGKWFVEAKDLRQGDTLRLADGKNATVEKVWVEVLDEAVAVYNFEVADYHTYFVSELGVMVHNTCSESTKAGYKYWKKAVSFSGNKVYQRNDLFDPKHISSWKRNGKTITGTNIERMASGKAPIGYDGKSVNLHHLLQTSDGAIVEVSNSFHKKYYSTIHINTGKSPSLINRSQFNSWASKYWMNRAKDFK